MLAKAACALFSFPLAAFSHLCVIPFVVSKTILQLHGEPIGKVIWLKTNSCPPHILPDQVPVPAQVFSCANTCTSVNGPERDSRGVPGGWNSPAAESETTAEGVPVTLCSL